MRRIFYDMEIILCFASDQINFEDNSGSCFSLKDLSIVSLSNIVLHNI